MNIYATVDVAAVTEEVVEGVYAGQVYQDISSTEATGQLYFPTKNSLFFTSYFRERGPFLHLTWETRLFYIIFYGVKTFFASSYISSAPTLHHVLGTETFFDHVFGKGDLFYVILWGTDLFHVLKDSFSPPFNSYFGEWRTFSRPETFLLILEPPHESNTDTENI